MIRYAFYSDIGGRAVNEDTVKLREQDGALCAVLCDGLGGHGSGDKASQKAAGIITEGWTPFANPDSLIRLTQSAHREILAMQSQVCQMKTTAVVLSVSSRLICYAYIGDSRLYHFAEGSLKWQTTDHSASQIAVLLGQITPKEIRFHEDRSRILRALGQLDSPGAEGGIIEPRQGRNAFLLCSDGFWEYVDEDEMQTALGESSSPEEWLDRMRVYRAGRIPADCDNNSAAAVWLENDR